jgi:hypothetical protein
VAWHDDAALDKTAAMHIGRQIHHPRGAFGAPSEPPFSDERQAAISEDSSHAWGAPTARVRNATVPLGEPP